MADTYLKRSLDSANDKVKYDENVKMILSDKTILSWILKYSAKEYMGCSIDEIWICMEEGRNANTIREYRICPRDIYSEYKGRERYDLLSVVMVRLPKDEDVSVGNMLHKMLTTLLSSRMSPKGKEEILERTYGIPMSYELKEARGKMCNLSDLMEKRNIPWRSMARKLWIVTGYLFIS